MKKKKLRLSNILFALFIILLIIPQTRTAMQIALNTVKVKLFSPSALDAEDQTQLEPFSYQLVDLKGNSTTVEVGQGKGVFLNYWATWCPPCIAEMPSIQRLYNDFGDTIDFVLLTEENPEVVRTFLAKKQYDLPVYIPRMQAPKTLYERSIPTTYVIDRSGKIIVKEQGATDWNSKKLRALLEGLVKEAQN